MILARHIAREYALKARIFAVLAAGALAIAIPVGLAVAQTDSPFYWESIDVEIDVRPGGDMWVTETHVYVFERWHTNQRSVSFPSIESTASEASRCSTSTAGHIWITAAARPTTAFRYGGGTISTPRTGTRSC